jgi:antitoxin (DNA-binding transcriptional repressor) of toxin-antitoxin stability system
MIEVTMQEMEKNVRQLIQQAIAGEEVVILSNNLPVVRLSAIKAVNGERKQRVPGSAKGLIRMVVKESATPETVAIAEKRPPVFGSAKPYLIHMADDFDEPLEDFAEYMQEAGVKHGRTD